MTYPTSIHQPKSGGGFATFGTKIVTHKPSPSRGSFTPGMGNLISHRLNRDPIHTKDSPDSPL